MVDFSTYIFFLHKPVMPERRDSEDWRAGGYDVSLCKAAVIREHGFYFKGEGEGGGY
jgi:hypothetical protein